MALPQIQHLKQSTYVTRHRMCHPKICHFGIRIIWTSYFLKNNRQRKALKVSISYPFVGDVGDINIYMEDLHS